MQIRREFLVMIGVPVVLNILFAFAAIGLFTRMSPAIERILLENVYSIQACEEMLAVLAEAAGGQAGEDARSRFEAALRRARNNVTEEEEKPVLDNLERDSVQALTGDSDARHRAVLALAQMVRINREAMGEVDREARRLGAAGAWTAAFIAAASFLLSILATRRLRNRILQPLVELHGVLSDVRSGEGRRRCRELEGPIEVRRVLESVNHLLDHGAPAGRRNGSGGDMLPLFRGALLRILDQRVKPTVLVDAQGSIEAANAAALDLLGHDGEGAWKKRLARLTEEGGAADEAVSAIPVLPDGGWLCELKGGR